MTENNFRYFEFGEFRLDAHRRILRKNGETVHLTPRSFDLLCVLVENAGRILDHDELLDKVWEGTFVEQGNLKKAVSNLRHALGESPETSEFITTVPRRGYRFTAPVRPLADETILIRETRAEIVVEEEIEDTPAPIPLLEGKKSVNYKVFFGGIAFLALTGIFLSYWFFWRKPMQRFSVEKIASTRFMSADNLLNGILSNDGNLFVYTTVENDVTSLRVRQIATGGATKVFEINNASLWFFTVTPDNQNIYFTVNSREDASKNGLYRVSTFGGAAQLITEKEYLLLRISPDGKQLAAVHTFVEEGFERQELLTMNPADGSGEKRITLLPNFHLFRGLSWSSDGKSLAYGAKNQPAGENAKHYIAEVSASGGEPKILLPEQEKIILLEAFLPDKNSLLLRQRETNAEIYQLWQYFPSTGEMNRVTKDDYFYNTMSVSNDGKLIGGLRLFMLTSVWLSEPDTLDFKQIVSGTFGYASLEWTADNRLLFSTMENGAEYVGIMNADGSNKRLLTKGDDGIRLHPVVSRNGKNLIFLSNRTGGRNLWQIDFEGRNLTQITDSIEMGDAKLLSDGQTVVYSAYPKTKTWCVFKRAANGATVQLTDTDTQDWDVSFDEKHLAYFGIDAKDNKVGLFIRDLTTGAILKKFEVKQSNFLRWSRDSSAIIYARTINKKTEIVSQPIDGSAERILTIVQNEAVQSFDWSPDGKRFALIRSKVQNEAVLIRTDEIR